MAAKTQPRATFPFTGQRYLRFRNSASAPDFMHGTLNAYLIVAGSIRVLPHVAGDVAVGTHVRGKVQVNP